VFKRTSIALDWPCIESVHRREGKGNRQRSHVCQNKNRWQCFVGIIPPLIAGSAAMILTVLGNARCQTISFKRIETVDIDDTAERKFGPFYTRDWVARQTPTGTTFYRYECVNYPEGTHRDSKWKAVVAFAAITVIVGGITLFYTFMAPFLSFRSVHLWKLTGFLYIFCSITQGLTLLILESDLCKNNYFLSAAQYESECHGDWGFVLNIVSVVFWFLAGGLILTNVVSAPTRPPRPPAETQTITYSGRPQKDGTTVITESNVIKGTYDSGNSISAPYNRVA